VSLEDAARKMQFYVDESLEECIDILKGAGIGRLETEEWD
jgi:hypothetical protein